MDRIRKVLHHLNQRNTRIIPKINPVVKFLFLSLLTVTLTIFVGKIYAQTGRVEDTKQSVDEATGLGFWVNEAGEYQITNATLWLMGKDMGETDETGNLLPPGGLIGFTNNAIASLYKPQASGIEYIAHLKDNLLGKPAYAQGSGVGFQGLEALLPIWRSFRNVVYLLAAFIFIIIGIMIMLRVKVSPQAVITIQSAIPQIIITLVLVTFSYAIAGLLIDLSNLLLGVVIAILYSSQGKSFADPLISWKTILNPDKTTFSGLNHPDFSTVISMTSSLAPKAAVGALGGLIGVVVGGILGAGAGGAPEMFAGGLAGGFIGGIIFLLLIQIAIIIWLIKLFFGMVKCYVTILFKIILSPLEIALGAFPSSKVNFKSWLIDLLANISVFPITIIFLTIVNLIIDKLKWGAALWRPDTIDFGVGVVDVATFFSGGFVPVAIGLAAIMIVSKLPELIPQAVFMLKPSPWGLAIGEGFGAIKGTAGKAAWGAGQYQSSKQAAYYKTTASDPNSTADEIAAAGKMNTFWDVVSSFSGGKIKR